MEKSIAQNSLYTRYYDLVRKVIEKISMPATE